MNSGHTHRVLRNAYPFVLSALLLALAPRALAQAYQPDLGSITPPGVQRGAEVVISLNGDRLNDPLELVHYDTGIEVVKLEAGEPKENRVRQVKATLRVAPDCPLGEHRFRLRTKTGWSHVRTLYIGTMPVVKEIEPNDAFDKPQAVMLNQTIEGVVQNEDVDYYVFNAKKGQRITAEIEGIRLGRTMFDPYVAILDMKRFELAASDDTPLLRQDGFATIIAPEDGAYVVLVRESAYGGSGSCIYRLHLGDYPRPTAVYPAGGRVGESLKVTYLGDKSGPIEATVKLPDTPNGKYPVFATQGDKISPSPNWVRVSAFPNVLEAEPNNSPKEAATSAGEAPLAFNGVIQSEDDQDWFRFTGKKGQTVEINVHARGLRTPLDPVIYLYQAEPYKSIKGDDDDGRGDLDGSIRETLPADGDYFVRIRDHLGKGGEDYVYRVEVQLSEPSLSFKIADVARYDTQSRQWAAIPKGNCYAVKIDAQRGNFGGDLTMMAENLPAGVKMYPVSIPGNATEGMVVFEAAADAPIDGKLAKLWGRHVDESKHITGEFRQRIELVQGNPNSTSYYTSTVNGFPVAVTEEAPFKVAIIEPKAPLLRSGTMYLKVVAERKEGFDAPIHVELPFRPPGVGASQSVTIDKGKTEASYRINANGSADIGDWSIAMIAKADMPGGGDLYLATRPVKLTIADQLLTGEIAMSVTEQGKDVDVICKLNPQEKFEGEAELELVGLPDKCSAEPKKITKDDKEVVFHVKVDEKSPVRLHTSLFCQLTKVENGETMVQSLAGGGRLRIDKPKPAPVAVAKKSDDKKPEPAKKTERPLSRLEQLRLEREQQSPQSK
ncbi:MAG: peptidase [Phycisphaera sp.]|nr:peptidase [Phycisphaera sp.]